jgi:hypothetical protein
MAARNLGLAEGLPPPSFAATVISLESFEKSFPRLASKAPLNRFTFDHLLWPAMRVSL